MHSFLLGWVVTSKSLPRTKPESIHFYKGKKNHKFMSVFLIHGNITEFLFDFFGFILEYHSHTLKIMAPED